MNEFEFKTTLRERVVNFRKWKVKDKKKLSAANGDKLLMREALVYDCLEDKTIAFSNEEYNYLLIKIREKSLNDKVKFSFECGECTHTFDYECDLNVLMKPVFIKYGDLISNDTIFTMGNIKNRKIYETVMAELEDADLAILANFILHIESFNDNDGLTFDDLSEIIDNLDVQTFEDIINQWEDMQFKVDTINNIVCPYCGNLETYEFDSLPGFFPESWNI